MLVPALVRGRCACGRRYRIRNCVPGTSARCPNCQRPIVITEEDWRAGLADERLIPVQAEHTELREAIPVDFGELMLASEGARPGLTGGRAYDHEEALLMNAMRGWSLRVEDYTPPPATRRAAVIELEAVQRTFVGDLLASFYLAGNRRNAANVLLWALACTISVLGYYALLIIPFLTLLMLPVFGLAYLCMMQFFWTTLRRTALGEDEIPWVESDWGLWEDGFRPAIWIAAVSALCSAPAWALSALYPPPTLPVAAYGVALAAGWFFWPVAIMSVAIGDSLLFARPDWLIRCVIGVGPVYVLAWLLAMLTLGLWIGSYAAMAWLYGEFGMKALLFFPPLLFLANIYFGFVLFRNFGLIFRHFRERFPWKF